ncbi:MAG: T9SS type A sorting domain-containing protein [Chitinophagaceae bacterium]|nr:T9SS type A sorting domain-containing protein [Chitinophagaceae bacterium]
MSKTYDTLVTGNGVGDHQLNFAQWDPSQGDLVAVRIQAQASVRYGYTLRNVADSLSDTYTITVGRQNTISSPTLTTAHDSVDKDIVDSFSLEHGKWQWKDPALLTNNYNYKDSITDNIESFKGTGRFLLNYSPMTWSTVNSTNNTSYHYDATFKDSTLLSVTYFYTLTKSVAQPKTTRPGNDKLTLYPNPAQDYIQLTFNTLTGSNWQVDILAADGHNIQSNRFNNATQARVNFTTKLAAGAYFARVTDICTSQHYTVTFTVL